MEQIDALLIDEVKAQFSYMVEERRYFHRYPELARQEFQTAQHLKDELKGLDLSIHDVEGTGFYAVMDSGRPGKTLGIRTDIDALPITEQPTNLQQPRVCVSENEGVMHACGHDAHIAIQLGVIKILHDLKAYWTGKIIFIFEEGEEISSGISAMIEALAPLQLDAIYGTHVTSFMEVGQVSVEPGPRMAGAAGIDITVKGKGGHGSRPDLSVSPIFGAANIITALGSAWVNQVDVTKTVTLGLGSIQGGSVPNVIPEEVTITGSMRYFDLNAVQQAQDIVRDVAQYTAKAHRCEVQFGEAHCLQSHPVINDPALSKIATKGLQAIIPDALVDGITWYASESFSRYSELSPTLFAFVGIRNEALGSGAEHHNEYFDVDEEALYYGAVAAAKFAIDFLADTE